MKVKDLIKELLDGNIDAETDFIMFNVERGIWLHYEVVELNSNQISVSEKI